MYTIVQGIAIIIATGVNVYYGCKFGLKKSKSTLFSIFTVMILYMFLIAIPWIESGFKEMGEQNMIKVYAFAPIVFAIDCLVLKMDYRKVADLHSLWAPLAHGLGHFACLFANCCTGYRYLEGTKMYKIAYMLTGTDRLPLQIMESIGSLTVAAIIVIIAKKKDFKTNGRLGHLMLVIFGAQRIGWEFLRYNDKVIVFGPMSNAVDGDFGISYLTLYAVGSVLVGSAFLIAFHFIDKKKAQEQFADNAKKKIVK